MPSAYTQNFYHIVFSTKHRTHLITPELESRLYPFMGGIVRDLRCKLLAINGMPDHVHLLIRYRADLSHSEMLQQIKGRSSKWMNETFPQHGHFSWQEGYGGFTVSKSAVPEAEAYMLDRRSITKARISKPNSWNCSAATASSLLRTRCSNDLRVASHFLEIGAICIRPKREPCIRPAGHAPNSPGGRAVVAMDFNPWCGVIPI